MSLLNQRVEAAREIGTKLVSSESVVDDLIIGNAELTIAMIRGRRTARVSIDKGQGALDQVAEAAVHLSAARRAYGLAHANLAVFKIEFGLPPMSFGDTGADSPDFTEAAAPGHLRIAG